VSAHAHVRVNPIACEAHGMCAELLPERIALDEWGYPIVDPAPLTGELLANARRAAESCPTFALLVERGREPGRRERRERSAQARQNPI
jgi:ferredoxin